MSPFRTPSRLGPVLWTVLAIGAFLGVQMGLAHHVAGHHTCDTDHPGTAPTDCTLCQAAAHLVAVQTPVLDLPTTILCASVDSPAEPAPSVSACSSLQARAPPASVVA
jgi:hypothetical protein|nr:hypothetical protein [Candidatus Krumholzibacteria bacterium]